MKRFFLSLTYARRELRAGLTGFYIFLACLVLGVATISTVRSLSEGLLDSLRYDGRYLLGGDLALRTIYEPPTKEQLDLLKKHAVITTVMETRAMTRRGDETKATMVELKAIDPYYPLYGGLEFTDQAGVKRTGKRALDETIAAEMDRYGHELGPWGALVEKELLSRLNIKPGDAIRIGKYSFVVRGIITKEPDRIGGVLQFSLAPRVMISRYVFDRTGLREEGGQVYFDTRLLMPQLKTFQDLAAAQKRIVEAFPAAKWKGRSFYDAAPQTRRMVERLDFFLSLIALTALLIGGVGVSNAVKSFLDGKLAHIATLKCLGASQKFVFRVYMAQILYLAALGIFLGVLLGIGISLKAGTLLTAKLELTDRVGIYPEALGMAAAFGLLVTLCFSLWPLGRAVNVSPAELFRDRVSPSTGKPSADVMLKTLILAQLLALLAVLTSTNPALAAWFAAGALVVFAVFYCYAFIVKTVMKRIRLPRFPEMRLAIANLHRPGNAVSSVVLSLGLGLTVLVAIALVEFGFSQLLHKEFSADAPSFFFLDIQPDQKESFTALLKHYPSARNLQMTPSIRGRVVRVNGAAAEKALVDKGEEWVIRSDRGFTRATKLPPYSRITEGQWWDENYQGPPLVSIATNVAKAFNIGVGDQLTVNILGTDITATVANVRDIDWASFTMNFAITFAPGAIDKIPSNFMGTVIIAAADEEAMQTEIAKELPNITCVRVRDALAAAGTILTAVGQAVRISAAVMLLAGALVLAGGVAAARRRHIYDAVILKVLGAPRPRIIRTFLLEYGILGVLTVIIAALLGTGAGWAVVTLMMNLPWQFSLRAIASVTALCLAMTLAAGFLGTWQALRQKPSLWLRNQ